MKLIRNKFTYDNIIFWVGLAVFALSSLLTGCSNDRLQVATEQSLVQTLHYYQSDETGLCYAFQFDNANHPVMTNVPCSPEVLAKVTKTQYRIIAETGKHIKRMEAEQAEVDKAN